MAGTDTNVSSKNFNKLHPFLQEIQIQNVLQTTFLNSGDFLSFQNRLNIVNGMA